MLKAKQHNITPMNCPYCRKKSFVKLSFHNIEASKCGECHGIWFDKDHLRQAKDDTDQWLVWLDVDLWKDKDKYKVNASQKQCPVCDKPLYEIKYGDSNVKVDICDTCQGSWLDKGEFNKIIDYLQHTSDTRSINEYLKASLKEAGHIVTGPEAVSAEAKDFVTVFKLLQYKLLEQHPILIDIILNLPFTK